MISGEGVGGDEKDLLKDNLMRDIQDGFRQRRLPDGGFKVSGGGRQIDIINMERPSNGYMDLHRRNRKVKLPWLDLQGDSGCLGVRLG